ncbi:S1-C subfamily serine protease [Caulobacter ginsengisoli]|uniref:S1-C subfamily serine protease n=1 Tax=Caulobacter ginsengisoli TaxID=400775 RepID=A0ABU0IQ88_9CAUL|nr:serine protease [Caulobacter ginsengisoli]MDQ0464134.1 S1-C subfamily serine protease [Caulobacter ginsengisoli]
MLKRRLSASAIFGVLAVCAGLLTAGLAVAQNLPHPKGPRGRDGSAPPPPLLIPAPPALSPGGRAALEPVPALSGKGWVMRGGDTDGEFDVYTYTPSRQPGPAGTVSILAQFRSAEDSRTPQGRAYRYGVMRFFFQCKDRRYAPGNADYYDAQGRVVSSDPGSYQVARLQQVRDGSVAEFVYEAACDKEPPGGPRQFSNRPGYDGPDGDVATGSGWLSARGYIVTASHVVAGGKRIWIYQEGRKLGTATVVRDDPVNDVAFLKPDFDVSAFAGMNVETQPLGLGQRVFTLGYPLVDQLGGGSVKLTSGDISSLTGVDIATQRVDDPRYLQISIPVQSGNSGGPVIDDAGGVVGIVLSKSEMTPDREIMQNVNFALKASYISQTLAGLPQVGKPRAVVARPSFQGTVAEVQSGIFLIVVEEGPTPTVRQTSGRR